MPYNANVPQPNAKIKDTQLPILENFQFLNPLSQSSNISNGWMRLPNGLKMAWGSKVINNSATDLANVVDFAAGSYAGSGITAILFASATSNDIGNISTVRTIGPGGAPVLTATQVRFRCSLNGILTYYFIIGT